ncbi:DUF6950 family protein [Neptunicella sp. SCSIO 80796]|uniref:DUF6950 family protein n=1 Tax=Neptunicella plasticusilytica TaxID=3117012 RepID=UPI003A4DC041
MRLPNWQSNLNHYIRSNLTTPFAWGTFDCCLFTAAAVEAITGTHPIPQIVGRYRTELGAARALKKYGKGTIKATLNHLFGTPKPRLQVCRGDVVLVETSLGDTAGIVMGGQVWVATHEGLSTCPLTLVKLCWEVK